MPEFVLVAMVTLAEFRLFGFGVAALTGTGTELAGGVGGVSCKKAVCVKSEKPINKPERQSKIFKINRRIMFPRRRRASPFSAIISFFKNKKAVLREYKAKRLRVLLKIAAHSALPEKAKRNYLSG
jgi:hypothetical protein